jgi:hypothetical protein
MGIILVQHTPKLNSLDKVQFIQVLELAFLLVRLAAISVLSPFMVTLGDLFQMYGETECQVVRTRSIILKWIFVKWDGGMDWIDLAQNGDRWWASVKVVINLQVPQNMGNS